MYENDAKRLLLPEKAAGNPVTGSLFYIWFQCLDNGLSFTYFVAIIHCCHKDLESAL